MTDVTHILTAIEQGDLHAAEHLLPLVYDELRRLAAEKMAQERPGQTLQATALVLAPDVFPIEPGHALTRAERQGRVTGTTSATACMNRARRDLGYEPSVTFEDGLEQTLRWY